MRLIVWSSDLCSPDLVSGGGRAARRARRSAAMTSLVGNEAARATFLAAMRGPAMHHAWLFSGPEGVGKGTFARAAAARLLAEAAAPGTLGAALDLPEIGRAHV